MAEYLKIPDVARRLDVSEKTVRRYIKAGTLPSTFIGGAYRVTEEDLEEFIHRAEVKPEAPKVERRSSLEPSFNDLLADERRIPALRTWTALVNRLADRWEQQAAEREDEWRAAEPAARKVKRLPNLVWGVEINRTANDVVDAASEELEAALGEHTSREAIELFSALRRLGQVVDDRRPWFEDAGAEVTYIQQARQARAGRMERLQDLGKAANG